ADEVSDGGVGRRQLLAVALAPVEPRDGRGVATLRHQLAGVFGDGVERVVVDLGARDLGHPLVEEAGEEAEEAALGLPAEAEEDEVVPREEGVLELRDDGLLVAEDAGEDLLARAELLDQV